MKKDYTGIEQYYAVREKRLKDKIDYLESEIQNLNVIIKEQSVKIEQMQTDLKYKSELIERMTKYSNAKSYDDSVSSYSKSFISKLFKK